MKFKPLYEIMLVSWIKCVLGNAQPASSASSSIFGQSKPLFGASSTTQSTGFGGTTSLFGSAQSTQQTSGVFGSSFGSMGLFNYWSLRCDCLILSFCNQRKLEIVCYLSKIAEIGIFQLQPYRVQLLNSNLPHPQIPCFVMVQIKRLARNICVSLPWNNMKTKV